MSIKEVDCRTGAKFFVCLFFSRFSRQLCEADLERETRAIYGEQVLQAIKEIKNIKENKPVSTPILFLAESKRENRIKILDSMLT